MSSMALSVSCTSSLLPNKTLSCHSTREINPQTSLSWSSSLPSLQLSINKSYSNLDRQATNGQVTKKDDLKELNTKLDASLGGICLIPNGRSTNEIKDRVSIGIQHKTTLLNSTTRKHPINENCILPTVNKSEPLHFSNSNTFATENDIGVTSANLESSSKAVSTANGLNKMSGRATCVQEFENESSSNLMGKNTTQQLQSFNDANDDGVRDALDDLSSLSVNMPLSWAAKFGVKAGDGQVSHSQNGDQGRSKF